MPEYIKKFDLKNIIENMVPSLSTPDGSGENDQLIFAAQEMCVDILHEVENIKPEDVAPVVHGKWENSKYIAATKCGVCGEDIFLDDCEQFLEWKYCPICGAKMDLEE